MAKSEVPQEAAKLTEFEKASLLMQASMVEYLRIIAWTIRDTSGTNVQKATRALVDELELQCPSMADIIGKVINDG